MSLADDAPQAGAAPEATLRYADRLAGCGHDELAEGLYGELLSGRPEPGVRLRALSGLAASLARQGRHDEAERIYAAIVGQPILAPQPTAATTDARRASTARRSPATGGRLRLHTEPPGNTPLQESVRVDGTGIKAIAQGESRLLSDGGSVVSARIEDVRYEAPDRSMGVQVTRPGIRLQQRLGQEIELHGNLGADRMERRGMADASTRLTYDTGLGLRRDDLLRVRIGSSRTSLDDLVAQQRGGVATAARASVDLTPDGQSRYGLRYERGALSDGSLHTSMQAETEHRLGFGPNMWLGGRVAHSGSLRPGPLGEADLTRTGSTMLTLRLEDAVNGRGGRLGYGIVLGLGDGLVLQEADRPRYDLSLRGSWRMSPGTLVEARLQSLGSSGAAAGVPAHRTAAGVNVNFTW